MTKLALYFSQDFVWFALIVGILIALCASLFGVILVLKRFSFIGDGLSHVAFGAMAIAAVLKVTNSVAMVMPVTVICAVLLLKTGQRAKLRGDAAIAVFSVGALAIGYLLLNIFPNGSSNIAGDVCSSLFGASSILFLKAYDVWLCLGMSVAVLLLFIFNYNRIFAVTFDEDFSKAIGVRASLYNLLLAIVTAVIIVMAMELVGSLLISALIIFPALSAMRVFRSFKKVIVCSAVISVTCAVIGILAALILSTPVGPTIVATDIVAFVVFAILGRLVRKC